MSLRWLNPALDDDTVLPVGHDLRHEEPNEQVWTLIAKLGSRLPALMDVVYIELAEPPIDDAVETMAPTYRTMAAVPLSLFVVSHTKNNVPLTVRWARVTHDDTEFRFGSHLGIHPSLVDLLDEQAWAAESDLGVDRGDDDIAVVLRARGSGDPGLNGDVHKLTRLLCEGRESIRAKSMLIGVTTPRLEETLHTVVKDRPDAVVVLPYMFGNGVLTKRIVGTAKTFDGEYPYVDAGASGPLGIDARVVETLANHYQETRSGNVEVSCDTYKYKAELAGYEDDEGGARTVPRPLVRQAEHTDRSDVNNDPRVHDAPEKHVTARTNQACAADDAATILEQLRQGVRDADDCDVHAFRSSCFDQCGDGPIVVVYLDSVWYGGATSDDTGHIVSSHLERDHIISNLVHRSS